MSLTRAMHRTVEMTMGRKKKVKQPKCPNPRSWEFGGHLVRCFGPEDPTHTGKSLRHYEGVATVASQRRRIRESNPKA